MATAKEKRLAPLKTAEQAAPDRHANQAESALRALSLQQACCARVALAARPVVRRSPDFCGRPSFLPSSLKARDRSRAPRSVKGRRAVSSPAAAGRPTPCA